jgi:hypothetical protein
MPAGWQLSPTLNLVSGGVDPLQQGNGKSSGLACAMHKCKTWGETCQVTRVQARRADSLQWGGSGPTCPVLRSREDISTGKSNRDALFLNGTGLLKALLVNAHQKLPLEQVILKVITFRLCDILSATQGEISRGPRQARMSSFKKFQ